MIALPPEAPRNRQPTVREGQVPESTDVLFAKVWIFDGSGVSPYPGEVRMPMVMKSGKFQRNRQGPARNSLQ